jgi:hypothetical protein
MFVIVLHIWPPFSCLVSLAGAATARAYSIIMTDADADDADDAACSK